jgi:6-phospho-3-hexuloisomerase
MNHTFEVGIEMKYLDLAIEEILQGIESSLKLLDEKQVEGFLTVIINSNKILIVGQGRSGLVGRAFAMRLMHLGLSVYVVGETITPSIEMNDLLFAISGSGRTSFVVNAAETAKKTGAKVVSITSHPGSPLGKISDHTVVVRGRTKLARSKDYTSNQMMGIHEPLAPLGTMFEISSMVFLDSVVAELMDRLSKSEDDMRKRHAVIE